MFAGGLRRMSAMANVACSPFSRAVFAAMRKLYPESLADKSFDNTGLLLEAPYNPRKKLKNSVLLTIDLTSDVAQEAIDRKCSVVVTYHPIIFRGLKQLTLENSQQRSLLRLAAEGISVYSPHTAVDAASGGNADWMADIITGKLTGKTEITPAANMQYANAAPANEFADSYKLIRFPPFIDQSSVDMGAYAHTRSVVKPDAVMPDAGIGRVVEYKAPRPLKDVLELITAYFSRPVFSVACAYGQSVSEIKIGAVGICAGSGSSVIGELDKVDLLITGEMSHHEALAAVESGKTVITFNHSNSERGYLDAVMGVKLLNALWEEWTNKEKERMEYFDMHADQALKEMLSDTDFSVFCSSNDRDPFETAVCMNKPFF